VCYGEKSALENGEAARYAKMVNLEISASGHKVSAAFRKLMSRCMWPGYCRLGHSARLSALGLNDNDFPREQIESGGRTAALQNVAAISKLPPQAYD